MKRILAAAALVALCSSAALAGTKTPIANSKHDLSSGSSATIRSNSQTQICIFCHTPHNAVPNIPLWNRSNSDLTANTAYKLYTSSATLTYAKGTRSVLATDSISLLCLSCHDGTLAQLGSRARNKAGATDMGTIADHTVAANEWGTVAGGGTNKANFGADLTSDHPIGFTYPSTDPEKRLFDRSVALTKMNTGSASDVTAKAIFFKAGGADGQMECASCHMVHDDANKYFLRTTNANSQLCLACHDK